MGREAQFYPYLEEVNQSILRAIEPVANRASPVCVLDVGCGYGALGLEFRRRGYLVWGIERDPGAMVLASERLDRLISCDITDPSLFDELRSVRFEIIVFSDVLEHMQDPSSVLGSFTEYLEPGGRIVISVPNVANWHTRIALLFGRFDYRDTGVLDRTHLRFFTRRSAREFVRTAGLCVESMDYTPMLFRALLPMIKRITIRSKRFGSIDADVISDSRYYRAYLRFILPLERQIIRIAPGLLAFQVVVTATMPEQAS